MARPRKTEQNQLAHVVAFRVNADDYQALKSKASASGLSVNDLARRLALSRKEHLQLPAPSRIDPAMLKRLDRIGHNLNQLVKRAHIYGKIPPKISATCELIEQLVQSVIDEELPQ